MGHFLKGPKSDPGCMSRKGLLGLMAGGVQMALTGDSGTKQMQVLMRTGFVPEKRGGGGAVLFFPSPCPAPSKMHVGHEGTSGVTPAL